MDILKIIQEAARNNPGSLDYNGIAVVIGALGAFIVSIINAVLNWKAKTTHDKDKTEAIQAREQQNVKLDEIHTVTNSAAQEVIRQKDELKSEIARVAIPGAAPTLERPAGEPAPPSVTIDKGVVTVADKDLPGNIKDIRGE